MRKRFSSTPDQLNEIDKNLSHLSECYFFLGNTALISEALRHYQRLENEKSTRKSSDKQQRRHYHLKEYKIRPIIVQQAVTHKIKVEEKNNS
jgi:hypothetical protein